MNNLDFAQLFQKHSLWSKVGPYSDTVLSTRIKLIRNIYNIPFSYRQERSQINFIRSTAERFIKGSIYKYLELLRIDSISELDKRFLSERKIISQNMAITNNCFVILADNEDFNIMINDEDHFKIQVFKPGFQACEAYRHADEVDNELNRFAIYAFSEDMGYITSSLFNNPCFKISIILHLPVLSFTKEMMEVQNIAKLNRLNIKGLREDGIKTIGSIFILSNDFYQDVPETKIIEIFERTTHKIISLESEARENYLSEHAHRLEDRICRSYGLLRYARKIGYVESMNYLSDIRLGIILSVIKNMELQKINDIMINIQWYHLQKIANRIFNDAMEGDIFRASYLRDQFEWSTVYG